MIFDSEKKKRELLVVASTYFSIAEIVWIRSITNGCFFF